MNLIEYLRKKKQIEIEERDTPALFYTVKEKELKEQNIGMRRIKKLNLSAYQTPELEPTKFYKKICQF